MDFAFLYQTDQSKGAFVWEYSGIRMYSGIIFRLFCSWEQNSQNGIQVFRNENSSQTNAYLHYSNYSYSGLIPNERALSVSVHAGLKVVYV